MTTVHQKFVDLAIKLINKNGMDISLNKFVLGLPVDPTQPWKPTASTATTYSIKAVFLPEETINRYEFVRIPYEITQEGFQYCLIANNEGVPALAINDEVVRAGESLRIKYLKPYAPDGTVLLYVVGIKS